MRVHLFSALATLKIGLDILFEQEQVKIDKVLGHGGFFKTKEVGQKIMAAAMNVPVSVMETAGEGGAWGIALLASYMLHKERVNPWKSISLRRSLPGKMARRSLPIQRMSMALQSSWNATKRDLSSKEPPWMRLNKAQPT